MYGIDHVQMVDVVRAVTAAGWYCSCIYSTVVMPAFNSRMQELIPSHIYRAFDRKMVQENGHIEVPISIQ